MITITNANKIHADAILNIMQKTNLPVWSLRSIENECDKQNAITLVAMQEEIVVGFINMSIVLGESEINNIAVHPDFARQSIATQLLLRAIDSCKTKDIKTIMLDVRKTNTIAICFYKKHGFYLVGERKNFYTNPTENALLFNLNLANNGG